MKTVSVPVQNLKCQGCASTIENKLTQLINISAVEVDVENKLVTFDYSDNLALHDAKEALKLLGYPEVGEENSLGTKAKSYVSCMVGKMG